MKTITQSTLTKTLERLYAAEDDTANNVYETILKNYFGAGYCLALSSGTAALIAALVAVRVTSTDQVIAPPTAPLCTAYPILSTGATLTFCDVQPGSFGLDLSMLARLVGKNTRAIIDVPMWGYATPAAALKDYASSRSIPLIFDLAHCVGTQFHKKSLSNYCDIACFSTQKHKIFSSGGEGGFLLTNNEEYYKRALKYSRMGELNGYDFGLNYKLSSLQAEIGIEAMKMLGPNLETRRRNSARITSGITHPGIAELEVLAFSEPSYQRLVLQSERANGGLAHHMFTRGIPSDMHKYQIKPLYDYPILSKLKVHCPNAERLLLAIATIPVHHPYSEQDLDYIIDSINSSPQY